MRADERAPAPTGVIHDIGYQRYTGPRLGRRSVFAALYVHGLRTAFGLGRTAKAKIFPWMIVAIVGGAAIGSSMVHGLIGEPLFTYAGFADVMSWLVFFFVAAVAPELVSRDLRAGVLPLYFSRPLPHTDYVLAKLAALATAVWLLLGAPQLFMFAVAVFTTDLAPRVVKEEVTDLLPGLAYAGVWAVLFATVGLLVASLTGRRAFAAGGIVAVFLMTTPIVGVLSVMPSSTVNELAGLAAPLTLVQGVGVWLWRDALVRGPEAATSVEIGQFGPVYGLVALVVIVACLGLLLARYRKVAAR
ncbi:MAG TPA: ABC transporter permease [Micromonospora sp.]